jgi:paraquat-inducible protein A
MTRTTTLPWTDFKTASGASHAALVRPRYVVIALAVVYFAAAIPAAWNIIAHAQNSTQAIEHVLITYNMKNEGSLAVDRYAREHPLLGFFLSSPVRHELELPSAGKAEEELTSGVRHDLETVRSEASIAAWWSWGLISFSLLYVLTAIALDRSFSSRAVLFALTSTSVFCFVIGIFAPAMIIWTAPQIPMESGQLSFVLQHEVRGIAAIIRELLTGGHWIIGGFLLLFSIITPMTKASLTFLVTASSSREFNRKIGEFLHTIGKWSMADVFVAAVLLALYALKFQEATKSIPCLGLYYFIGYCMLSMTTTEILVHSSVAGVNPRSGSKRQFSLHLVAGLFVVFFCFVSASGVYTYEQYTENEKQPVHAPSSPEKLNNANLVLPAHKSAP